MFRRSDASPLAEFWRTLDKAPVLAAFILLGFGLLLSLAAGPAAAARVGLEDPFHYVYRHALFVVIASGMMIGCSMLDPRSVRRSAGVLFLVCFVLMLLVLLFGHEAKGATRWLRIGGATFQPSEIAKPSLIVLSAWILSQRSAFPGAPWNTIAFAFFAATIGLLLLQPDVGQAVLLTAAFVAVFFVCGLPLKWAAGFLVGSVALAVGLYNLLPHVRRRIDSFLNPSTYDTYQIDKAREAIERGGLLGVGPGEGTVKRALPDAHTDLIYAVAGEEYGLLLCGLIVCCFAFITVRGVLSASRNPDLYQRAAGVGLFSLFGLQAAINIAVSLSLIPPKGMTLPLVSSGGSSMLGAAITLGYGLALMRRTPDIVLPRPR